MYRTILAFLVAPIICASAAWPSCVRLSWTAPGDDNYLGRATAYDLRYSTDSVFLVNNFNSASQVQGMISPQISGAQESFVVAGLITGVRYFFAIKTADERNNWSPLSNVIRKTASGDSCSTPTACMRIRASIVNPAYRGQHNFVDIMLDYSNRSVGGFDLLFGYNYNAYTVSNVRPGNLYGSCGWEYFSYWLESTAGCSGCPAGLLRVRAAPELNNGSVYPACSLENMSGSIIQLDFLIANDPTLDCRFLPVNLFWLGCDDNVFVSSDGEAQWLSREVFDYNNVPITDPNEGFPDDEGAPNACLAYVVNEPAPSRCVDFTSGGLNVACGSSNESRGDVNMNGQAYEVADAVTFSNYFMNGMDAFEGDLEAQVAATDVNGDGLVLTVVDLVSLVRIITGDLAPISKSVPSGGAHAELAFDDGVLSIASTDTPLGGMHLVFDGEVAPELDVSRSDVDLEYRYDGAVTRVLIWDITGAAQLGAGPLLHLKDEPTIRTVDLAGYNLTTVSAHYGALPDRLTLSQNAPNPFNPTTSIRFALPSAGATTLTIFNIAGQRVATLVDGPLSAGFHTITWDARDYASGVYLYRLTSGDHSESRKMILLK